MSVQTTEQKKEEFNEGKIAPAPTFPFVDKAKDEQEMMDQQNLLAKLSAWSKKEQQRLKRLHRGEDVESPDGIYLFINETVSEFQLPVLYQKFLLLLAKARK